MAEIDPHEAVLRRGETRYPLRLRLSFSSMSAPFRSGHGETLQISRRELVFTAKESAAVGQHLRVALDWPMRIDRRVFLRLIIVGQVVRSGHGRTAMTIEKHEFRIRAINTSSV